MTILLAMRVSSRNRDNGYLQDIEEAVTTPAVMEAMERSLRLEGRIVKVRDVLDHYWAQYKR
jgi:hypothetical protein